MSRPPARLALHDRIWTAGITAFTTIIVTGLYFLHRLPAPPPARHSAEYDWLARTYGPDKYSIGPEEWIIRDALGDRRGGIFVDIGAGDPIDASNTYFLEHHRGWSGLAVDPQERFRTGYASHRPGTIFETFFVGDRTDDTAKLFVTEENWLVASKDPTFTERFGNLDAVSVPTVRLTDLLDRHGISSIDFLNVDVELAEPEVLAGFDVMRFRPAFVCIEAHPEVRQAVLSYFANAGYTVVGKYLRVDLNNLYFMPVAEADRIPRFPPEVERAWSLRH